MRKPALHTSTRVTAKFYNFLVKQSHHGKNVHEIFKITLLILRNIIVSRNNCYTPSKIINRETHLLPSTTFILPFTKRNIYNDKRH